MNVSYNKRANAVYIQLNDHDPDKTQMLTESVYIDYDKNGEVSGIEILHADKILSDPSQTVHDIIGTKTETVE